MDVRAPEKFQALVTPPSTPSAPPPRLWSAVPGSTIPSRASTAPTSPSPFGILCGRVRVRLGMWRWMGCVSFSLAFFACLSAGGVMYADATHPPQARSSTSDAIPDTDLDLDMHMDTDADVDNGEDDARAIAAAMRDASRSALHSSILERQMREARERHALTYASTDADADSGRKGAGKKGKMGGKVGKRKGKETKAPKKRSVKDEEDDEGTLFMFAPPSISYIPGTMGLLFSGTFLCVRVRPSAVIYQRLLPHPKAPNPDIGHIVAISPFNISADQMGVADSADHELELQVIHMALVSRSNIVPALVRLCVAAGNIAAFSIITFTSFTNIYDITWLSSTLSSMGLFCVNATAIAAAMYFFLSDSNEGFTHESNTPIRRTIKLVVGSAVIVSACSFATLACHLAMPHSMSCVVVYMIVSKVYHACFLSLLGCRHQASAIYDPSMVAMQISEVGNGQGHGYARDSTMVDGSEAASFKA
ncbi:hypothetical protein B0H16DRAFT_1734554 [Mycena metata]|uniref:Transmembrane protein n=1 Tax=Mycena metata TaxID=1033252 RepID=A0AAD7HUQ7_9AGAR|nr:hypothetical protein B0H16DRAFT_1734554 [Mycena metata]